MVKNIPGRSVLWTAADGIAPEVLAELEPFLSAKPDTRGVSLIKDNTVRSAFFYTTGAPDSPRLFVKLFKKPAPLQCIRHLFVPSKVVSEWRNLRALEERGLPCPRPLAYFEKRSWGVPVQSCLVTQALDGAEALNVFLAHASLNGQQRFQLTRQLARLSAAMHAAGMVSRDYHGGNILIRPRDEGGFELFLIDLHKARLRRKLRTSTVIGDLAKLASSLTPARGACMRFLKEYCRVATVPGVALRECLRGIARESVRIDARRIKSRSRRCVLRSSVFHVARTWSERYCGRRDFGHASARQLVERRRNAATVVKKSAKSLICRHELQPGQSVCLKVYPYRGLLYGFAGMVRRSRALKSWTSANGLIVRGLLTPRPLAMVEKRFGPLLRESYYICDWLEDAPELNTFVLEHTWQQDHKGHFIRCLAHTLARMHARGVYHGDLKSNNILVRAHAGSWEFYFVDLDRVSFSRPLTFERRANNLAQINASVSGVMTLRDRLLFFRLYARAAGCYTERKRYYRRVLEISRGKNTKPYGLEIARP